MYTHAGLADPLHAEAALTVHTHTHTLPLHTRPSRHTGLADPVYAEAALTVHQYDIVLDVTVVNRTPETLQSVCLELATMGDLKLVERPHNYTLAPGASKTIRCAGGGGERARARAVRVVRACGRTCVRVRMLVQVVRAHGRMRVRVRMLMQVVRAHPRALGGGG